ncbi:hemicentin-1-like [Pomacea canaliculata]|uniref:hemicentin-1-like n=1 Tax=Pomacea canaliculata TaxID=400727 RepID=UPI000D73A61C|nr:hemicentin-1-like [Pomacea canaliculata]
MLGFKSTTAVAVGSAEYGEGSGPVLFSDLQCVGNETSLAQCPHWGLYIHDCDHWEDVGVICNITMPVTVRLSGGTSRAGRLEISVHGEWLTVCQKKFKQSEVEVACRMLGFNRTRQVAVKSLIFETGSGYQFSSIKCQGRETSLDQCRLGSVRESDCFDVGILCDFRNLSLRLTGADRISNDMGLVEVEIASGLVMTLCVQNKKTAAVICRQLNLTSNYAALIKSWSFGRQKNSYLEAAFVCEGDERSLDECEWTNTTRDCSSHDIGIFCARRYNSPLIVSGKERYPFTEGANRSLVCSTPATYQHVEYTWSLNASGRPNGHVLTFDTLTREYNGRQVQCQAKYRKADVDVEIVKSDIHELKVYYQPSITITWTDNYRKRIHSINTFEVIEGHNVTLWCEADSNPRPASITWSGRVNSTTGELRILSADHVTHSGVYTCTVVTETVDDDDRLPLTSSYHLTVGVQDLEPRLTGAHRIRQDVGRVEVRYNGTWGAVCGHVSNNCATVICRRLGHSFVMAVTTSRVSPFGPRPEESFVVTDLQCTGRETSVALCVQSFIGLSDRCESEELGVICTGEASFLYIVLATTASYPLMEGSNVSLKCENARTFPPVTNFTWPKSGGGRAAGQFLIFDNITKVHNKGQVMCAALYKDNTTQLVYSDTSILEVYYAPSITIISEALTCTTQMSLGQLCGVTRGHNATLVCEADSNPPPASVQWLGNGQSATQELTITAADSAMHDGFYHCVVKTGLGAGDSRLPLSSHYLLILIVQYPPSVVSFQLNNENQTAIVNESSDVNMICAANGRPAPRMMLVRGSDGQELKVRPQGEIGFDEERRDLAFFLCKAECQDSGDYRCEVDNGVGHDSKTIRLLVQCAPRRKDSEGQPQYLDSRGNNRNFSINMIAYPTPQAVRLTYQRSVFKRSVERPLTNDTIIVTCGARPLSPAEVTCHIGVTQADEGFYQVLFSNDLGNLTVGFTVTSDVFDVRSGTVDTKPREYLKSTF